MPCLKLNEGNMQCYDYGDDILDKLVSSDLNKPSQQLGSLSMNLRYRKMQQWLQQQVDCAVSNIATIVGDASFRKYYRVGLSNGQTYIIMDAPPQQRNCSVFVDVATLFASHGVSVPTIFAQDFAAGFVLLEDFGDCSYFSALSPTSVTELYAKAYQQLQKIQSVPDYGLPDYSEKLLREEMQLVVTWYLGKYKKRALSDNEVATFERVFDLLIANAFAQPQVCVHRDFHSRNLMLKSDGEAGVLDFQDAVIGPVTYDLVSLLKDCYIAWSPERRAEFVKIYFDSLSKPLSAGSFAEFERWFDWMGLQRHLKCLGIFARLHIRDQKSGYLADIPRLLHYVREVCCRYHELQSLLAIIDT